MAILKWFNYWWWEYLLAPRAYTDIFWVVVILCRARNHPAGVVWFNPSGWEPDYHCKTCGDNLN